MTATASLPDENTIERRLIRLNAEAKALRAVLRAVRKMRLTDDYLDVVASEDTAAVSDAREVQRAG